MFEHLKTSKDSNSRFTFDLLDDKLRSEQTRSDVMRDIGQARKDNYLWELKQGCMTAVVNCLSLGERAAFVLKNILSLKEDECAFVLGTSIPAFRVRVSRANKKITDYLAPRCEHVDPNNPCRCPSRVGVALVNGFIGIKKRTLRSHGSFGRYGVGEIIEDAPLREIEAIYAHLPNPEPMDKEAMMDECFESVDA